MTMPAQRYQKTLSVKMQSPGISAARLDVPESFILPVQSTLSGPNLMDDDYEHSAIDTGKTKKRASLARRGLQSCRRRTTSTDCLRLAMPCWSRTRPRTVIGTSPSQWDYDQDGANCIVTWLVIARLGHHDNGLDDLASWQ